jgi:pyridoxal phosphate enzyme (YggS family)
MPALPSVRVLRANLERLRRRVEDARKRSPRAGEAVTLVAVTKSAPDGAMSLLPECGVTDVAENRVQAAERKKPSAPAGLVWHGIGHLQRNKARRAVALFDVFHALDSAPLAEHLDAVLASESRTWPVYVEVNAARDPRKGGVPPEEAIAFLAALADRPRLKPVGWMTMAREDAVGEDARPTFALLREIRDEAVRRGVGREPAFGLSMGMSADFEVAVEEGATAVRLGRCLWEGLGEGAPAPLDDRAGNR